MRKTSFLVFTSLTFLISSSSTLAAASRFIIQYAGSAAPGSNPTQFVVAPYTSGSQELFSASIVNVNPSSLNSLASLSGNNRGAAPQGGLNVPQGGLGFATLGLSYASNPSVGVQSGVSGTTGTSSAGFSSVNNTSGLSSAGFSSANNTSGTSSSGFSSANNTSGLSSAGFTSIDNNGGSSSAGFSSANNTSGTSSAGFSSANNTSGSSSVGGSSANNSNTPVNASSTVSALNSLTAANSNAGSHPVLVLSSLVNSTNPKIGSTGAAFQGIANTQVSSVSFQFGTLAAASGQATAGIGISPLLVIDDQPTGSTLNTRFVPVSAGTVSQNGSGLTTVSFTANQLGLSGQVQRIGISLAQRGVVVVDNITVNGVRSSGIIAQAQQSFPF